MLRVGGIVILVLLFCFESFGAVSSRILGTIWNQYPPDGKAVEIKNIDFVQYDVNYLATTARYFQLHVYTWVKWDAGAEPQLNVFDYENTQTRSLMQTRFVGFDKETGYYVYKSRIPVRERFDVSLAARLEFDSRLYFSHDREHAFRWTSDWLCIDALRRH